MTVVKPNLKHAVLLALETGNYGSGTPALVAASDGFLAYERPKVTIGYQHDGARDGQAAGGFGYLSNVEASGRFGDVELVHYFKGAGAAYSATIKSTIDLILQAMGFPVTVTTTAGAEKRAYAPSHDMAQHKSLVAEIYDRSQKYSLKGAYVHKLVIEAKGLVVPKITASLRGIMPSLPVDAALPGGIVYPGAALRNPKATAIGLTLGAGAQTFSAGKLREHTLTIEREIVDRTNQCEANGDHGGFALGPVTAITLAGVMELTNLVPGSPYASATAIDPYRLYETGNFISAAWGYGATDYNKLQFAGSYAQFTKAPEEQEDGRGVPLWGFELRFNPQDEGADNALTITTPK